MRVIRIRVKKNDNKGRRLETAAIVIAILNLIIDAINLLKELLE